MRMIQPLVVLFAVLFWHPAQAQHVPPVVAQFSGQVTALIGPDEAPQAFVLDLRLHSIVIHLTPDTTFIARSAEADVEGFAPGDYASVTARRVGGGWVALRIVYDVSPISRGVSGAVVTGTIDRVAPDGSVRLVSANGIARWVTLNDQTRYEQDGVALSTPPALTRGMLVQMTIHRVGSTWFALLVNIRTSPPDA